MRRINNDPAALLDDAAVNLPVVPFTGSDRPLAENPLSDAPKRGYAATDELSGARGSAGRSVGRAPVIAVDAAGNRSPAGTTTLVIQL
jgi:hypothetical protein